MSRQNEIYQHVVDRGYREGWSSSQFLVRQILKMIEEVGELAEVLEEVGSIRYELLLGKIKGAGFSARELFDSEDMPNVYLSDEALETLRKELPDVCVTGACASYMTSALTFGGYDWEDEAVEKSEGDVESGS